MEDEDEDVSIDHTTDQSDSNNNVNNNSNGIQQDDHEDNDDHDDNDDEEEVEMEDDYHHVIEHNDNMMMNHHQENNNNHDHNDHNGGEGGEGDEHMVESANEGVDDGDDEDEDEDEEEDQEDQDQEEEEVEEVEEVEEEEEEEEERDSDEDSDDKRSQSSQQQPLQEQIPQRQIYRMPEDYLIPIRLDVQNGLYRLTDTFLWNLNETQVTPEQYAKSLCTDVDSPEWFDTLVATSINNQINHHREVMERLEHMLPALGSEKLVTIVIDLNVNGLNLKDQFEWDILGSSNVESFARSLCLDLGLSREFENAISFNIREQIQHYYQQLVTTRQPSRPPINPNTTIRNELEVQLWSPFVTRSTPWLFPMYPPHLIRR